MDFSRLQYITDSPALAEEACAAGIRWVQARIKNKSLTDTEQGVREILSVCRKYGAICIVNDYPELALACGADGVHVGKEDKAADEVRKIFGTKQLIVGATANTLNDVKVLAKLAVDYIGLGPLRFTTTKEKLSPVLGIKGYADIFLQLKEEQISCPPVYAIGGVLADDVRPLISAGVYGVAVSGVISREKEKQKLIKKFHEEMEIH